MFALTSADTRFGDAQSSAHHPLTQFTKSPRTVDVVSSRWRQTLRIGGGVVATVVVVLAGLVVGTGWLYVLRGLHWLAIGPRVGDSLPLLQLAAFDGQPLLRVLVAWLLAGALTGVALSATPPWRRVAPALALALIALLFAAQASYALTRNLSLSATVFSHGPGAGPVLEAIAFAVGCWLPRRLGDRDRARASGPTLTPASAGSDDRSVSGSESGDAGQHNRDREPVSQAGGNARA
jgi:hypothetical protein